jgi:membrane protein YqaA with SNARE-associated domain
MMLPYLWVFLLSLLVDLFPFIGPPAWTVMVFCKIYFNLNIWPVLFIGVMGSTLGRYILSKYVPYLFSKVINHQKNEDVQFIGQKLNGKSWKVQLFVLLYTLVPLPSTPLFTAAGMARIRSLIILPAFFVGKFTSDMIMVLLGDVAAENAEELVHGLLSWKTIAGTLFGIVLLLLFLFIDWRSLLEKKKLRINFKIWREYTPH